MTASNSDDPPSEHKDDDVGNKGGAVPSIVNFHEDSEENTDGTATLDTATFASVDSVAMENNEIWYFGYGPIAHPQVRARRGVSTSKHQACVIRDHRLTFAFGGAATLVPATGYTVHGVLMKVDTVEGWKKLKDFDSGYSPQVVDAFTYKPGEFDISEENEEFYEKKPVPCFAFVMLDEYDENIFEHDYLHQMEKKPQERYLRLIADGMLKAGVDPNYVEDEILAVPFLPTRAEKDWISFPIAAPKKAPQKKRIFARNTKRKEVKDEPLPRITFEKYKELCDEQAQTDHQVYFVLHNYVLRLIPVDNPSGTADNNNNHTQADVHTEGTMSTTSAWNSNPSVQWMRQNAHGKGDLTHISHVIVTDPAVPWAPTPADLQPIHYRWAENQMYDFLVQSNVTAEKVYELITDDDDQDDNKAKSHSRRPWAIFNCQVNSTINREQREQEKAQAATKSVSVEGTNSSETNSSKKQDQNNDLELDNVEGKVTRLTAEKASAQHFQKAK